MKEGESHALVPLGLSFPTFAVVLIVLPHLCLLVVGELDGAKRNWAIMGYGEGWGYPWMEGAHACSSQAVVLSL